MSALPLLVALAVPALLGLLGSRLAAGIAAPRDGALYRATLYVLGGALVLHLLLTLLDFAGIPWHQLLLISVGTALYLLGRRFLPRGPERLGGRPEFGWGDGIALFVLAVFTLLALSHLTTFSDFVFHWGIKGRRFFVARGTDYTYLARRWNWVIHPDYPNLLPEIYAVTALLTGRFDLSAMMLEASLFFGLLLAAAREGLRQGGAGRFVRQAGLAAAACAAGAYAVGSVIAGGADGLIALALAAAVPPLLRPPDRAGDFQIGLTAAFAAASKTEGVPLAAFLVLAQWGRRAWGERRPAIGAGLRAGLPVAAVVLPWLWRLRHHHLFQAMNSGPFTPSRAPKILAATLEALQTPSWHGLLWTVLLPPLLLLHRRARPFAAVATLQTLFYFYNYFTSISAAEPRIFILSNFARLGWQLIPAILVVGLVVWGGGNEEGGDLSPPLRDRDAGASVSAAS
ncbi:MAG TPA: hypothetical protein VFR03_04140 [Thermoanaerobaculia bacterium]|nr:hypothetical protein [Thermoanaerobaculia bacterium]